MDELEKLYTTIQDKYYSPGFNLKKQLHQAPFFRFFFVERPRINRWNKRHGLLEVSLFKVELAERFKYKIDDLFIKYLLPIKMIVEKILEEGWKFKSLKVQEYNTLVLFMDFLNKMDRFGEKKMIYPKMFFLVEEAFLKLVHSDEYVNTIIVALEKVMTGHKGLFTRDEEKNKELINNVNLFFLHSEFYPSMYHFIQAYNIYINRRMLDMDDIAGKKNYHDFVQEYFYDCSFDIFRMIVGYSKNLKSKLQRLKKDKAEIEWIRNLLDFDLLHKPILIVDFLQQNKCDWGLLSEDFFDLMITLFKVVLEKLERIIYKNWQVMSSGETILELKIIHNISLEVLYKKMFDEYYKAKARYSTNVMKKISLEEYFDEDVFKDLVVEGNSKYIYLRFKEIVGHLYELSYIFRRVYNEREKTDNTNRFLNYMIETPEEWQGRPVFAVFKYYSELFMQIAGFLRDKDIHEKIGRLETIHNEIDRVNSQIDRIMDQDRCLEQIIEKAGPDLLSGQSSTDEKKNKQEKQIKA